ncbi:hypothetical protein TNCV_2350631 [Trichonephila clavipes]|uniref:Uncharacterized protein n=1 Tax=Trichonephila clavipes TaxID=2585209 RepID=A0A8X6SRL7_TRICX|nr:hypothetical protein TNCV_2350631 [Trichonephila clavipes]
MCRPRYFTTGNPLYVVIKKCKLDRRVDNPHFLKTIACDLSTLIAILQCNVWKKKLSFQEDLDILQNQPSENSDAPTDGSLEEEVPANNPSTTNDPP